MNSGKSLPQKKARNQHLILPAWESRPPAKPVVSDAKRWSCSKMKILLQLLFYLYSCGIRLSDTASAGRIFYARQAL